MGALVACSPVYNWREVRHDHLPGQMLMPCKPDKAERTVPLLGPGHAPVTLWMLSCDVEGHTFAWSALQVPPGADLVMVEQAWRRAAWAALAIPLGEAETVPAGWHQVEDPMRPLMRSHWKGPGRNHRGQALQAHLLWVQTHASMHLAALYATDVEAEVLSTFLDSFSPGPP